MTNLTSTEKNVLAAWFARSNMGMTRAPREKVQYLLKSDSTLESATISLCQEFMETDQHEAIFQEEAEGWFKTISKKYPTRESILKVWPDIKEYFW
jgi:hypothetical protein